MNTLNVLVSLGLGLLVGAVILGAGIWMDRTRDRRWWREMEAAEREAGLRPPLPRRIPKQRDADGA